MLPLLLMGESVVLDEALVSRPTDAESPATLLPASAAEPLALWLGGDDVHLALRTFGVLSSELPGQVLGGKLLDIALESSGLCSAMFVSCDCGLQLH